MGLYFAEYDNVSDFVVAACYTDGGCLGPNPSPYGGSYAFVLVNAAGERLLEAGGVILPGASYHGLDSISNNVAELEAASRSLEYLPDRFAGHFYTDSNCTKLRLFAEATKWEGIPDYTRQLLHERLKRLGKMTPHLLAGHPDAVDIERGFKIKDEGKPNAREWPVSIHNARCDAICNHVGMQRLRWMANQKLLPPDYAAKVQEEHAKRERKRIKLGLPEKAIFCMKLGVV